MKQETILTTFSAITAGVAAFWGGLGIPLQALLIFMALDYIAGVIVAAVFKKSKKTESGTLSSAAGFKGLIKKSAVLLAVLVAYELDMLLSTTFVKDTVILAYIFNEAISLIENIGLMGVYVPEPLKKGIELLKNKDKAK